MPGCGIETGDYEGRHNMLPIISPAEVFRRDDEAYVVDFYWRCSPILERIEQGIKENSCGALRSLRFTWSRPRKNASDEAVFLGHTLPAALDGAQQLAQAEFTVLHIEKVPGMNNLFALAQFDNGVVAELELNECLPATMPDSCFIKANFTNGHITNQPVVGHFNEEGAILATDEALVTMICETGDFEPTGSMIEQMRQRFRYLAEQGKVAAGEQGAGRIMALIDQALGDNTNEA